MIPVRKIRDLVLDQPLQAGRPPFVTASSGLVVIGDRFYVAPDDELHLAHFSLTRPLEPGRQIRVFPGELPVEPRARKKAKPDFESLIELPGSAPGQATLLAIPSGSTSARRRGVQVTLPWPSPSALRAIDFSPLYLQLEREFPGLNLEGAALTSTHLKLFQRGNGRGEINAVIELALPALLEELARGAISARPVERVTRYELGELNGVRLTFTDATATPAGEVLFLAVAEATKDAYEDGVVTGSAIGRMDARGHVLQIEALSPPVKAEGIALDVSSGASPRVLLVTDDDDPSRPSSLYELDSVRILRK